MAKVDFNGPDKLIVCKTGTTSLDIIADVYSEWKLWVMTDDNTKYLPALSGVGGDPINETINLGTTFFLENDWKIKPQEDDHVLTVTGNLYTRDGSSPFVATSGSYNVLISMARSNLIDTIVSGSGVTAQDKTDIKDAILDEVIDNSISFKNLLKIMFSVFAAKSSGGGTTEIKFRDIGDTKDRVTATVDSNGNRTAVTLNP